MTLHRQSRAGRPQLALLLLAVVVLAIQPASLAAAEPPPAWRVTGLSVPGWAHPNQTSLWCVDGSRADVVFVPVVEAGVFGPAGTYALNWRTAAASRLTERLYSHCDPDNGLLYQIPNRFREPDQPTVRFSWRDPNGHLVEHIPFASTVGSPLLVATTGGESAQLWVSDDDGASWQERAQRLPFPIQSFLVSPLDARLIYAQTRARADQTRERTVMTIFVSSDAGQTWEERATLPSGSLRLFPAPAPVDTLIVGVFAGYGSGAYQIQYLSTDGGRAFRLASDTEANVTELLHTSDGILRLNRPRLHPAMPQPPYRLDRSTDGGVTWQPVALPAPIHRLVQASATPDTLLLAARTGEYQTAVAAWWYSHDAGRTWHQAAVEPSGAAICAGEAALRITPYLPLTVLSVRQTDPDCLSDSRSVLALALPGARAALTAGGLPNGVPGGRFFPETRHNLHGVFGDYWAANGGLPAFGFPLTEPFREANPADGEVATVQYLERQRFEYHPARRGTPYAVQLGRLGAEDAAGRNLLGDWAFQPVPAGVRHPPGCTYVAETQHHLCGEFRPYWEGHGLELGDESVSFHEALALFGYPISEEFVDPQTGLITQYFERAVFEYHASNPPEHRVLLRRLGAERLARWGG